LREMQRGLHESIPNQTSGESWVGKRNARFAAGDADRPATGRGYREGRPAGSADDPVSEAASSEARPRFTKDPRCRARPYVARKDVEPAPTGTRHWGRELSRRVTCAGS